MGALGTALTFGARSWVRACVPVSLALVLGCKGEPEAEPKSSTEPVASEPAVEAVPPPGPGWCSTDGWCYVSPQPHGVDLLGVWAIGPDDAWAVGEGAMLVHWDGGAWSRVMLEVDPTLEFEDVWAASSEQLHVAVEDGSILSFDPRATPISISRHELRNSRVSSIWGSGAQDVWAIVPTQVVHFDGSAWTNVEPSPLASAAVVCGAAADDVYVLGDYGQVAHFDGSEWHKQQSPMNQWLFRDAWADANGLIAVGGESQLVEYAGGSWKVSASTHGLPTDIAGEGASLNTVTRFPDGEIWAGTDRGSLLVWKDERWSASVLHEGPAILDLATAGGRLFAVGDGGMSLVVERGEPWTEPVGIRRNSAHAVAGFGEHVWVVDEFNLWHFDGERWTPHETMSRTTAMWAVSSTEVHLIGEMGYRRFDGQALQRAEGLPHENFVGYDVWASGSDDVWMAAGNYLMHFDGQAWTEETIDLEARDIHGSGPDNVLVSGPSKTAPANTLVARRSGGNWAVEIDDEDGMFVRAHGADGGIAISRSGKVRLRDASGWHEIEPLSQPNAAVTDVWMHDATHIWALTSDRGLFRYDGAQWRPERTDMQDVRALGASEHYLFLANDDGSVVRRWLASP